MISYKRDVLERQSLSELKMGKGSPICERVRKKIVEYFKNNAPQHQIAKALQISSSTVHNIIRSFRETGEVFDSIQFKNICIALFTIQSLQSSFTGNYISTIYLYIAET